MDLPQIEEELKKINARLSYIETQFNIFPRTPTKASQPEKIDSSQQVTSHALRQPIKAVNLLGIVAVICFVLAAGFIIKLSIDSGWLTPIRQMGLAFLFGFSLIGVGLVLAAFDNEYASFLPAAGIIVLYLTVFATYRLYALTSYHLALGLVALVSILCVLLYARIKEVFYTILAAAGAYAGPLLLQLDSPSQFIFQYFFLCSITFMIICLWMRSRILMIFAAYAAVITTSIVGLNESHNLLVPIVLAIHFVIYACGVLIFSLITKKPLNQTESWGFFIILVLFYSVEYYFIDNIYPVAAPWISLCFAGLLLILYMIGRKVLPGESIYSRRLILAFTTLVCFHSIYLQLLPDHFRPWLVVIGFLGFSFCPATFLTKKNQDIFLIPLIAILAILAIEYLTMVDHLIENYDHVSWLAVSFASFVSIWIAILFKSAFFQTPEKGYAILCLAHFLAISAFYRLLTPYGSLYVSIAWLLYAVCIIVLAFFQKKKVMANSALVVLGFAAGKALLYDVSSAATVIRILCLMLTGIVLYGAGFLMKKINRWD